jgi:hypothetical protein
MAEATTLDYFGNALHNYFGNDATSISLDLGYADILQPDPDKFLAAIISKTKAWLDADGTEDNGTTIETFNEDGTPTKIVGTGERLGQMGYQYQITFWITDTNAPDLPVGNII